MMIPYFLSTRNHRPPLISLLRPLLVLFTLCLLTGCSKTDDTQELRAISDTANAQGNIADDLDAILEEAVYSLTTEVSDMISKVNNIGTPRGTKKDQYHQFLELRNELASVSHRIDDLEHTIGNNYRTSKISQELYQKLNKELDSLDQLMDSTEDQLEQTFHIQE